VDPKNFQLFVLYFTSILYEALPFVILGVLIAGLLEELVPQRIIAKIIPRSRVLAIAIGGLLGILFPMCECGIIPVMRRLLRKGVPLSCCTCYMLAGPIINVVVMASTYFAFSRGGKYPDFGLLMMGLRMGLGFLVAFSTSLIVEWQFQKHGTKLLNRRAVADVAAATPDEDEVPGPRKSIGQQLGKIAETALHDFVDVTVFLVLGALLAAASRILLARSTMEQMFQDNAVLSIAVMMGLAIVLCICSEADAFVAASFVSVQPAAQLAFLVLGPMLDFKLYMMYTRVFRPRLIWTIILAVVVQTFLVSLLTNYFLGDQLALLKSLTTGKSL
jgi:uncharacterized membrane protein YraQ (UPF0718 family)